MQTFLPDRSFVKSMEQLDFKRLGKQRVEAAQILEILTGKQVLNRPMRSLSSVGVKPPAWSNHPAVKMWSGHDQWLALYLACAIGEWCSRGYTNGIVCPTYDTDAQPRPRWWGLERFHASHRSNLIRKFPAHYQPLWPDEGPGLPYFWPTKENY